MTSINSQCDNCQLLEKKYLVASSTLQKLSGLKSKIIHTDALIRKYKEQKDECLLVKVQCDKAQSFCAKYEIDLKLALEQLQSLRQSEKCHQEKTCKYDSEISSLKDNLEAEKALVKQYKSLVKTHEKSEAEIQDKAVKELDKKLSTKNKEIERIKESNRAISSKLTNISKTYLKSLKFLQKLETHPSLKFNLSAAGRTTLKRFSSILDNEDGLFKGIEENLSDDDDDLTNESLQLENLLLEADASENCQNKVLNPSPDLTSSVNASAAPNAVCNNLGSSGDNMNAEEGNKHSQDSEDVWEEVEETPAAKEENFITAVGVNNPPLCSENTIFQKDLSQAVASQVDIEELESGNDINKIIPVECVTVKDNLPTAVGFKHLPLHPQENNCENNLVTIQKGIETSESGKGVIKNILLTDTEDHSNVCNTGISVSECETVASSSNTFSHEECELIAVAEDEELILVDNGNKASDHQVVLAQTIPTYIHSNNTEGETSESILENVNCSNNLTLPVSSDKQDSVERQNLNSKKNSDLGDRFAIANDPVNNQCVVEDTVLQDDIASEQELDKDNNQSNNELGKEKSSSIHNNNTTSMKVSTQLDIVNHGSEENIETGISINEKIVSDLDSSFPVSSHVVSQKPSANLNAQTKCGKNHASHLFKDTETNNTNNSLPIDNTFSSVICNESNSVIIRKSSESRKLKKSLRQISKIKARMSYCSLVERPVSPLPPSPPLSPGMDVDQTFEFDSQANSTKEQSDNPNLSELFGSDSEEEISVNMSRSVLQHQESEGFELDPDLSDIDDESIKESDHPVEDRHTNGHRTLSRRQTSEDQPRGFGRKEKGFHFPSVPSNSSLLTDFSIDRNTGRCKISIRLPDNLDSVSNVRLELDTLSRELHLDYGPSKSIENPVSHQSNVHCSPKKGRQSKSSDSNDRINHPPLSASDNIIDRTSDSDGAVNLRKSTSGLKGSLSKPLARRSSVPPVGQAMQRLALARRASLLPNGATNKSNSAAHDVDANFLKKLQNHNNPASALDHAKLKNRVSLIPKKSLAIENSRHNNTSQSLSESSNVATVDHNLLRSSQNLQNEELAPTMIWGGLYESQCRKNSGKKRKRFNLISQNNPNPGKKIALQDGASNICLEEIHSESFEVETIDQNQVTNPSDSNIRDKLLSRKTNSNELGSRNQKKPASTLEPLSSSKSNQVKLLPEKKLPSSTGQSNVSLERSLSEPFELENPDDDLSRNSSDNQNTPSCKKINSNEANKPVKQTRVEAKDAELQKPSYISRRVTRSLTSQANSILSKQLARHNSIETNDTELCKNSANISEKGTKTNEIDDGKTAQRRKGVKRKLQPVSSLKETLQPTEEKINFEAFQKFDSDSVAVQHAKMFSNCSRVELVPKQNVLQSLFKLSKLTGKDVNDSKISCSLLANFSNPHVLSEPDDLVDSSVIFFLKCDKDMISKYKKGKCEPPIMTLEEECFVSLTKRMQERKPCMKNLIAQFRSVILATVLSSSNFSLPGYASLCRLYTAWCKLEGNVQACRALCYNLIHNHKEHLLVTFLITNMILVWPDSLKFSDCLSYREETQKLYSYMLLGVRSSTDTSYWDKVFSVLQELTTLTIPISEISSDSLAQNLLLLFKKNDPSQNIQELCHLLLLLASREDWLWTKRVVLDPLTTLMDSGSRPVRAAAAKLIGRFLPCCPSELRNDSTYLNVITKLKDTFLLSENNDVLLKGACVYSLLPLRSKLKWLIFSKMTQWIQLHHNDVNLQLQDDINLSGFLF